ncbi:MAG: hypothetical protein V2G42_01935 [bacterium JZ-2024 1]
MSAVSKGKSGGLLNNPVFAGILVLIAIVTIAYEWKAITGGFPRSARRPRAAVTQPRSPGPAAQRPSESSRGHPDEVVARSEPEREERAPERASPQFEAAPYPLQDLTPPTRDPFAETVVKIEPLMGRAFEDQGVLPVPKVPVSPPAVTPREPPAAAQPPKPALPDLQVVMIITMRSRRGAVMKTANQEEILVFAGDAIGEETVSEIAQDGVILSGEYGTRALRLSGFQFAEVTRRATAPSRAGTRQTS